jgi:uncharacterized protein (TIGR02452 family)
MSSQIPSNLPATIPYHFMPSNKLLVGLVLTILGGLALLWKYCSRPKPIQNTFKVTLAPTPTTHTFSTCYYAAPLNQVDPTQIKNPVAQDTMATILQGHYINTRGEQRPVSSGDTLLAASKLIPNTLSVISGKKFPTTEVVIVEEDCLYAAHKEAEAGENVAVLVFASPMEPGGGMHDFGHNGQEEVISRRADIFGFFWDQLHKWFGKGLFPLVNVETAHNTHIDYDTVTHNRMLHTPGVTVFRAGPDKNYAFLNDPFTVGMLISAPPDCPALVPGTNEYQRMADALQLEKVITTIFSTAYQGGYTTLILGSFGSGAFRNPPKNVAKMFRNILETHFNGAFKKLVFPILDAHHDDYNPEGNIKPYRDVFTDKSPLGNLPSKSVKSSAPTSTTTSKVVDLYASLTGNPTHMGHMQMIALATNRLVQAGYQINQVKVALSSEGHAIEKVHYCNLSIQKHQQDVTQETEMLKVLIPRAKRIEFLRAAIQQAKDENVFDQTLKIDYSDDQSPNPEGTFHVVGGDFAAKTENFNTELSPFKHAVVVIRNEKPPAGLSEAHTANFSRLIVHNPNITSTYSSSKIQNGAYDQLPPSVRAEFKQLHQAAQRV